MPDRGKDVQPLSRPLTLIEVPPSGLDVDITATPAERAALARLNDLPEILAFEAKLHARRWRGDGLEVSGVIHARLRQTCVVSLEEFESELSEPVEVRFAPPRDDAPRSRRRTEDDGGAHDADAEDAPDPLIGGGVDLGGVASEFFTLALDPYPRKPGAAFAEPADAPDAGNVSPFAALRAKKP